MDIVRTALVVAGVLVAIGIVGWIGIALLMRRVVTGLGQVRWGEKCILCGHPISDPDQAVGVFGRAIPDIVTVLPQERRQYLEASPTRFVLAHKLCADTESIDPTDRVATDTYLVHATAPEQTCQHCRRTFTPPGMAILTPDDPTQTTESCLVTCPHCHTSWPTPHQLH